MAANSSSSSISEGMDDVDEVAVQAALEKACFPDPNPDFKQLFLHLRLFLAFAVAKCWFHIRTRNHANLNRTEVGTWKLLQMMDNDIHETACIELAECHHLAWVLGRIATIRPGSLVQPCASRTDARLPYLVWGDIIIERTEDKGKFIIQMTIRNLKTKAPDPEKANCQSREPRRSPFDRDREYWARLHR
ncbi:hypothetical protein FALBO_16082 [Fusarium albosuccineum]|uniref:Uncharacterized protein n=1 Tax=Fusarium albosuccineum TaxID=1237068 RepID=A0A8H4KNP2_9HYPO|nr:hypothetical protein FALBO_16082 [Fusarium albosuccineum]